jgi:hypothetical protein
VIEVAARVVGISTRDRTSEYELADSRVITIGPPDYRIVHDSGTELLIVGRDPAGRWAAIVGHQGGLPDDCFVLNEQGFNLGSGIAIKGVRFPKSPTFTSPEPDAVSGQAYPGGTRFCVNENGQVETIIPASWRI